MISTCLIALAALCGCGDEQTTDAAEVLLTPPAQFAAVAAGVSTVSLTWQNRATGYEGYVLERAMGNEAFAELVRLDAGAVSYDDKRVTVAATVRYRIAAVGAGEVGEYAETSCDFTATLPPPTEMTAVADGSDILLGWKDNCVGEEGYILEKAAGSEAFKVVKLLSANATAYTDVDAAKGTYKYRVQAYLDQSRSEYAEVAYSNLTVPALTMGKPVTSWYMVSVPVTVADDGGEACEVGVCWAASGTPTVDSDKYVFNGKLASSESGYGNVLGIDYGKNYKVRAFAANSVGVTYSDIFEVQLDPAPTPLTPAWTQIADYSLPQEVKLYRTSTNVTGRQVNAWYAEADLSTGNVELMTKMTPTNTTPTNFVKNSLSDEEVYVVANGGYFQTGASYSYVCDRGAVKASNISSLTRTYTYQVARGVLGVDAAQRPSLAWVFSSGGLQWAYDKPLPVVDGEAALAPRADYPSQRKSLELHSGIGGAPVLMRGGRVCFDYQTTSKGFYKTNYELLQSDIFALNLLAPRTAIGFSADGKKMVIMICDGRNAGGSKGVTLDELMRLMMGVGCTDVLNLDGGGSTAMVATNQGTLLNVPSDGAQRPVISFVGFVKKK